MNVRAVMRVMNRLRARRVDAEQERGEDGRFGSGGGGGSSSEYASEGFKAKVEGATSARDSASSALSSHSESAEVSAAKDELRGSGHQQLSNAADAIESGNFDQAQSIVSHQETLAGRDVSESTKSAISTGVKLSAGLRKAESSLSKATKANKIAMKANR